MKPTVARCMATALVLAAALALSACDRGKETPITEADYQAKQLMSQGKEVKLLEDILKQDPANLSALVKLGNIHMDADRCAEAVKAYGRALEIEPGNANVRVDMGTCYRKIGRSDIALEEYRKAVEANPGHAFARMNAGIVLLYDFGRAAEALTEFEEYLKIEPAGANSEAIRGEIARIKENMKAAPAGAANSPQAGGAGGTTGGATGGGASPSGAAQAPR